jgi:hypothetical protein
MNTTKVNLENFMTEAHKASGISFYAFHAATHTINERRGGGLYKDIKNGQMPIDHFVKLLQMFGA